MHILICIFIYIYTKISEENNSISEKLKIVLLRIFYFHSLAIVTSAAINMGVQVPL
jgi:hypothetical protein